MSSSLGLKSDSNLNSGLSFATMLFSTLAWDHWQKQEKTKKQKTKNLNLSPKLDPSLTLGSFFTTELFLTPKVVQKCLENQKNLENQKKTKKQKT